MKSLIHERTDVTVGLRQEDPLKTLQQAAGDFDRKGFLDLLPNPATRETLQPGRTCGKCAGFCGSKIAGFERNRKHTYLENNG
jgi:hypothetical protein